MFTRLLTDRSGKLSSTRFIFLLWGIGSLIVWMISSLKNGPELMKIPESVYYTLGILMAGKVTQNVSEINGSARSNPDNKDTKQ